MPGIFASSRDPRGTRRPGALQAPSTASRNSGAAPPRRRRRRSRGNRRSGSQLKTTGPPATIRGSLSPRLRRPARMPDEVRHIEHVERHTSSRTGEKPDHIHGSPSGVAVSRSPGGTLVSPRQRRPCPALRAERRARPRRHSRAFRASRGSGTPGATSRSRRRRGTPARTSARRPCDEIRPTISRSTRRRCTASASWSAREKLAKHGLVVAERFRRLAPWSPLWSACGPARRGFLAAGLITTNRRPRTLAIEPDAAQSPQSAPCRRRRERAGRGGTPIVGESRPSTIPMLRSPPAPSATRRPSRLKNVPSRSWAGARRRNAGALGRGGNGTQCEDAGAIAPSEPQLLRDHRANEVRVLRRQEVQPRLRSPEQSLAREPARADRDLRLAHLITDSGGSRPGSDDRQDAFLLVRLEMSRQPRRAKDRRRRTTAAATKRQRSPPQQHARARSGRTSAPCPCPGCLAISSMGTPTIAPAAAPGGSVDGRGRAWRGTSATRETGRPLREFEGWNVNGPTASHERLPPTSLPNSSTATRRERRSPVQAERELRPDVVVDGDDDDGGQSTRRRATPAARPPRARHAPAVPAVADAIAVIPTAASASAAAIVGRSSLSRSRRR